MAPHDERHRPPRRCATVDRDCRAGDEAGAVGGEIDHQPGDLLGRADPPERDRFGRPPPALFGIDAAGAELAFEHGCVALAGTGGVDPDVLPRVA